MKLYRSFLENGHFQKMPDAPLRLWLYLLLRVNHRPGAGCQPGEAWVSYQIIREECCYAGRPPWANSTISEALEWLEREGYIKRIKAKNGLGQKLRVTHWERYQGFACSDGQQVKGEVPLQEPQQVPLHKQEGKEGEEDILSPPASEKPPKPSRKSTPKAKKEPDPFNVAAQPLVDRLDKWLKAHNTGGVGEWSVAVKMTANALKGKGGPPIPVEEAERALAWGTRHHYWKPKILAGGPKLLREVWADWKQGGTGPQGGNRYQDHTQTQPTGKSLFED